MTQSLTQSLRNFRADAPEEEMQVFLKELTADMVTYFTAGFVSTIHEWLIRDDCTPGEIAAFLLDMIRRFEA